jgi:hypothetical protein
MTASPIDLTAVEVDREVGGEPISVEAGVFGEAAQVGEQERRRCGTLGSPVGFVLRGHLFLQTPGDLVL